MGALAASRLANPLSLLAEGTPGATVETSAGKVRALSHDGVQAFRGIPYGASTAGSARFLPAGKPKPWTGVRDAFELGLRCPQASPGLIPEFASLDRAEPAGEDCLVLNVWTPSADASRKRPVMVWLHGGGYSTGSAGFTIYDGANLAHKQDVVLVGVNHRLNVFGFLYFAEIGGEKYAQASNVGILDVVSALEWVRDNISAFGGDPGNVTIFGQSGGGGKVSTLLAMPSAKGLFHRAIIESGATVKGVPRGDASESAGQFLAKLGLKPNQIDQAQKLPAEQLVAAMGAGGPAGNLNLRLSPTTDGRTLPADPFYPKASALSSNVPVIVSTVETEVAFFAGQTLDPIDDATLHQKVMQTLPKASAAQVDQVIAAYRAGRPKVPNTDLYLTLASDATFRQGPVTEAVRKASDGSAPVYMSYFTWHSPVRDGKLRSFHTLEIPFIFENVDVGKSVTGSGQDRYALADRMSGAWAAFARTGNPNHPGIPHWPAFKAEERATMIFNDECKVVNDPHGTERRMVDALLTTT